MGASVLIVDDDDATRESLAIALKQDNYNVLSARDGASAIKTLDEEAIDIVVTDIMMGKVSGFNVLDYIMKKSPTTIVILITAYATIESAVNAIKKGAYDYLTKPIDIERLNLTIQKALDNKRLLDENRMLKQQLKKKYSFGNIIGMSPPIQQIFSDIEQVASTEATVLITGESGTGKELIAHAIHYNSLRSDGPLITVNCSSFASGVLESELFGHEKGAFTGALKRHLGKFEQAQCGTLFLDEIGDLEKSVQVKLLRVLQEKTLERVGGNETIKCDVRLIAATNKNLEEETKEDRFREDLYYRIKVVSIDVPPLREREEDIPLLVDYFLSVFSEEHKKKQKKVEKKALNSMMKYHWPGNVRELRNCIESLVVMTRGNIITYDSLPSNLKSITESDRLEFNVGLSLKEIERRAIIKTLSVFSGNKARTAEVLGIGLKTLYRRLEDFNIPS